MKNRNSMLAIAVFATAVAFASCKKDYNCSCKANVPAQDLGGGVTVDAFDTTYTYTIADAKKKDAKDQCNTSSTQVSASFALFGGTGSCELK